MTPSLAPFYYLDNFQFLINWIDKRYADVLLARERIFIEEFNQLPRPSQALLVRMVSRKGKWFRADKLQYDEIGAPDMAASVLIAAGMLNVLQPLKIDELARLLTKMELVQLFNGCLYPHRHQRKEYLIEQLLEKHSDNKTWDEWTRGQLCPLYCVDVQDIVDTFLLLFFGNPYQNLTEFVLQDLGVWRYEQYVIDPLHRIFGNRHELVQYQQLLLLREQLEQVTDLASLQMVIAQIPDAYDNRIMERRRLRLLNQLAYQLERYHCDEAALQLYQQSHLPPSRERQIRLLAKRGDYADAWALLQLLHNNPINEHELQIALRMAPRLAKKAGKVFQPKIMNNLTLRQLSLSPLLDERGKCLSVEEVVRRHFDAPESPCRYVENNLLNSLLGLWLWPELFRSIDGAFANPFQMAPLDIYHENFQQNRPAFKQLWQLLDDDSHREAMRQTWRQKNGIANLFVNWNLLDEACLLLALDCIPAQHLKVIFERLLFDLKENCTGLPDLIQFFPVTRQYCMIEVKGPGDRLQDNQQRWLDFFKRHGIPAEVCHVGWQ